MLIVVDVKSGVLNDNPSVHEVALCNLGCCQLRVRQIEEETVCAV